MRDSTFHVYLWRPLSFRLTLHEADINIQRTLFSCTKGVIFIEISLKLRGRGWVLAKTNVLWGGRGVKNEQGQTRGEGSQNLGILFESTFWMSSILNFIKARSNMRNTTLKANWPCHSRSRIFKLIKKTAENGVSLTFLRVSNTFVYKFTWIQANQRSLKN